MDYKGLTLDKFQEDAVKAIENNKSVVVSAPTGSGKTLIADYIIDRDITRGIRVIYTAPIKALSNQKYKEFSKAYGEEKVGMLTGDVVKNSTAMLLIMTTEIYRNMVTVNDPLINEVSYVVFDEIHFINDAERGYVWEESIIFSHPNVRMLCLSATIPNAEELAQWIAAIKEHEVVVVRHDQRIVPLNVHFYDTELGITSLKQLKEVIDIPDYNYIKGKSRQRRPRLPPPSHIDLIKDIRNKLPCLFFSFSRSGCQKKAFELAKKSMFPINNNISRMICEKLAEGPQEINQLHSTQLLRQILPQGIAFHHAGLLPRVKDLIEDLFGQGLINVLYTTETFAVGINMPAKTVCFEALRKFDGRGFRPVTSKEYFQIAGRAGRRGIDTEGFVYIVIERRDFDYDKIKKLIAADTERIISQFRLSVNTVLNLIKNHTPTEIDVILCKSFHSFQKYGKRFGAVKDHMSHRSFQNYVRRLEKWGYLKQGTLTEKGEFASHIYVDEMLISEIFATEFWRELNEYQILLLIACLCYEGREKTEFRKTFPSKMVNELTAHINRNEFLITDERFKSLNDITALIHPCYNGATIFDVIKNCTLLEGDIVRFFRQMIDRINQIRDATRDRTLHATLGSCRSFIVNCLQNVDDVE